MFKKHFWRKTKLVNLLTANLISLVRRTGRFLRPNMSSQQCLSCDSCLFLIHIPLIPPSRVLLWATAACLLLVIPCRQQI